ncbi:metallophosphoesterase [Candidatus Bipolaricaulota bacterium]|nr:metallophosphoesterase [Candidatus Bipolaricaulota bacterium]
MALGRILLLGLAFLSSGIPAFPWELVVAFTNDLHASLPRLPALEPYLAGADLILDAGDITEDLYRFTGIPEAEAITEWMGRVGYTAAVLGNHDMYLGPTLKRIVAEANFPVVVANMWRLAGVRRWLLVEVKGLRVLILGFLGAWPDVYYPWSLWPALKLLDPIPAAREALKVAPEHDLLIFLGHMPLREARELARAFPECDLFILGHDHLFLKVPIWVGKVPIVQAGHRAQAVGIVTLGDKGFSYRLVRIPGEPKPLDRTGIILAAIIVALLALIPRG